MVWTLCHPEHLSCDECCLTRRAAITAVHESSPGQNVPRNCFCKEQKVAGVYLTQDDLNMATEIISACRGSDDLCFNWNKRSVVTFFVKGRKLFVANITGSHLMMLLAKYSQESSFRVFKLFYWWDLTRCRFRAYCNIIDNVAREGSLTAIRKFYDFIDYAWACSGHISIK